MKIRVDESGTVEGLNRLLDRAGAEDGARGVLILACQANGFTPEKVDGLLKATPLPLFGGIFPGLIRDCRKLDRGTIVVGLDQPPEVYCLPGLSDPGLDFDRGLEDLIPDPGPAQTVMVLVDGYSQRITSLIDSLYAFLGVGFNYLGGGAGEINPAALDMDTTPCLFTNEGLVKDAALLALTGLEAGIGVAHGWHKVTGPFKVTGSKGNRIAGLDLRPAFRVYREVIEEYSGEVIGETNFFEIAKRFPFGINRVASEVIVRDPFTVEGDELVVATEVPQESFVDILTGDPESLIAAARKSATRGQARYRGEAPELAFMVDCISRALFLGDDFEQEIAAAAIPGLDLIGVLSLGEIANSGDEFMELYNKTCVVGVVGAV